VGGNTTGRPEQTLTWDSEDHLSTLVESTGSTSYLYDADGNRLVRSDPGGKILYLPGQEIRYTASTGTRKTTRYYTYAGGVLATRGAAGLTWLSGDHQGTASVAVTATTQAVSVRRFTPYGAPRGPVSGTWPSTMDKGFVGGTQDNTGLTHLGAREYDPALGRFISGDPVFNDKDPQSWQGYAYAGNTPVTASDASGLTSCVRIEDRNGPCVSQLKTAAGQRRLDEVVRDEARRQATWAKYRRDLNRFNRRTGEDREPVTKPKPVPVPKASHPAGCPWWSGLGCAAAQALRGPGRGPDKDKEGGCPWWSGVGCSLLQMGGRGTVAGCLNGGIGLIANAGFEWCVGMDKDGLFFEATTEDPRESKGAGLGLGVGIQVSDAPSSRDLNGKSTYGSGSVGPVSGGYAVSKDGKVHVVEGGAGFGLPFPGGSGGTSNTGVMQFGFCDSWLGVCMGPP